MKARRFRQQFAALCFAVLELYTCSTATEVMTADPVTVALGTRVAQAVELVRRRKFSELPVVDGAGRPVGLIDITDLIGLMSKEEAEQALRVAG